ncbi:MAG TPA: DUF6282 family protein [Solirubrobacteraceae bacterium]|jgi:hypothetical protein
MTRSLSARSLLTDAVDLHVHPAPSPYPRRLTVGEAAEEAGAAGMRAIVIKSHHNPTASDAVGANADANGRGRAEVFGGIVLNSYVGGFNADAVNVALGLGGRIVWLPTVSSPLHLARQGTVAFPTATTRLRPAQPVEAWTRGGSLRAAVKAVLREVAAADAVLASGHLDPDSIVAIFEEARRLGVRRLLVNHPNFIVNASRAEVRKMVELGAYVEHVSCHYDTRSRYFNFTAKTLAGWIRAIGPERSVLASDLGQADNPLPADSLLTVARLLRASGFTARELRALTVYNPSSVLGLE